MTNFKQSQDNNKRPPVQNQGDKPQLPEREDHQYKDASRDDANIPDTTRNQEQPTKKAAHTEHWNKPDSAA